MREESSLDGFIVGPHRPQDALSEHGYKAVTILWKGFILNSNDNLRLVGQENTGVYDYGNTEYYNCTKMD
jgi:hypothetical protein